MKLTTFARQHLAWQEARDICEVARSRQTVRESCHVPYLTGMGASALPTHSAKYVSTKKSASLETLKQLRVLVVEEYIEEQARIKLVFNYYNVQEH